MKGQWIGRYDGSRRGNIVVNVDERQSCFQGSASILDDDPAAPTSVAFFTTTTKAHDFQVQADIRPVDPRTRHVTTWEAFPDLYWTDESREPPAHITACGRSRRFE